MKDFSKGSQTKKNKGKKDNKLDRHTKGEYEDNILEECNGKCQLCEEEECDDLHHPYYGRYGADKDDRYLVAVCRGCHTACHRSKHGGLSAKAKEIAIENWSRYNEGLF